ncbi:MAG: Crp/Fnr family transcriptional regulator [Actinomycetota bacterium]
MTIELELRECPALAELPDEHLAIIAGFARHEEIGEGELLTASGEPADRFFVVRRGRFFVEIPAAGVGRLLIDSAGPHQIVGWSWLSPPYRWHFDTRAAEPGLVVAVDAAATRDAMEADHHVGYSMLRCFSALAIDRLLHTRLRLLDVTAAPRQDAP